MKLNDFNIVLRDAGIQDYLLTDGNWEVINTYLQKLDALNLGASPNRSTASDCRICV